MWGKSSPFACAAWMDGGPSQEGGKKGKTEKKEEAAAEEEEGRKERFVAKLSFTIVYDTLILPYEITCIW